MESKKLPAGYIPVEKTERNLQHEVALGNPSNEGQIATVTIIVKRRSDTTPIKGVDEFASQKLSERRTFTHDEFRDTHGAAQADIDLVKKFAEGQGLSVLESDLARRSVIVRGKVGQLNTAFAVQLHDIADSKQHRSYSGHVHLPADVARVVEHVIGLDNQPVHAKHYTASPNPPATKPLTPQQVAKLYNYPAGDGAGQTIGIYEMVTSDGAPGYNAKDLELTVKAFGGNLSAPKPVLVAIDGQANTNKSDGETVLDITVASAIAPAAELAVYFTGGTAQNIVHALQAMVHPSAGQPVPTVLSISYGWGPDDDKTVMNDGDYAQLSALFQDAAHLGITVLVSTGDNGAQIESPTHAQASYPSTDPWVLACGGTTIGDVNGPAFTEYVWNDGQQGGATGGGVSVLFAVPAYQNGVAIPKRNVTGGKVGRGIPDVSANASPYSGYPLYLQGKSSGPIGGTSAVAPLYAGLVAVLNGLLKGNKVGFLNPTIYSLGNTVCKDIASPPGPLNNNFGIVKGYPCATGWDACTGLGVADGTKLLAELQKALGGTQTGS